MTDPAHTDRARASERTPQRAPQRALQRALVVVDDDLAAVVACTLEVQRAEVDRLPLPVLWSRHDAAAPGAAQRLAEHFGLEVARQGPASTRHGVDRSRALIEAGAAAIELGISRVVWPLHAGLAARASDIDLDQAAREADRALLITRLLALDVGDHGLRDIQVDAPLADLSDRQLVDLALDLDAPIRLCPWWADPASEEHNRWMAVIDACGIPAAAGPGASAQTR